MDFGRRGWRSQLHELEARRETLTASLEAPAPVQPRLHPNLAQMYRDKVARLHEAFQSGTDAPEALDKLRQIIERIVLTPVPDGKGFEIELIGEIAAMVRLGLPETNARLHGPISAADHALFARSVKVVAGTGFEPVTFRS